MGRYSVPSGNTICSREAVEKRDYNNRYNSMGVMNVVNSINNKLKYEIIGQDSKNQRKIDKILINIDGTRNKSNYGSNAILGISLSVLNAQARSNGIPLYKYLGGSLIPRIMVNVISGGNFNGTNLSIKEFMIVPVAKTIKEQIRYSSEIFQALKKILKEKGYNTTVDDQGGFTPFIDKTSIALDLIIESIKKAGYKPGKDIYIALDCEANKFYDGNNYNIDNLKLSTEKLIKYYKNLINNYPIISIEDPFSEYDTKGYIKFNYEVGREIQIVGDDLFVTNKDILKKGVNKKIANSIIIKPNQVGTYTEMLETIQFAKKNNIKTIISHRSGETEDTTIADLAVGLNLGQIKCGSMSRTDRIAKYNRLIRIEENLGN